MDWLIDLLTNRYLLVSLSSWFVAQVLKTVLCTNISSLMLQHEKSTSVLKE